jgi:hypothetical protein
MRAEATSSLDNQRHFQRLGGGRDVTALTFPFACPVSSAALAITSGASHVSFWGALRGACLVVVTSHTHAEPSRARAPPVGMAEHASTEVFFYLCFPFNERTDY